MTIHFLLSHARLLNQLLSVFPVAGMSPEQLMQLAEISQEGRVLSTRQTWNQATQSTES